jgi:hypothetical protein
MHGVGRGIGGWPVVQPAYRKLHPGSGHRSELLVQTVAAEFRQHRESRQSGGGAWWSVPLLLRVG